MKAQAFLNLVSEMMLAQQDYFRARKAGKQDTHSLLVTAKKLENQVMKVIDDGRLEPDDLLDTPQEVRHPVDPKQEELFPTEANNGTTS